MKYNTVLAFFLQFSCFCDIFEGGMRESNRGLKTHPCGTPVLGIMMLCWYWPSSEKLQNYTSKYLYIWLWLSAEDWIRIWKYLSELFSQCFPQRMTATHSSATRATNVKTLEKIQKSEHNNSNEVNEEVWYEWLTPTLGSSESAHGVLRFDPLLHRCRESRLRALQADFCSPPEKITAGRSEPNRLAGWEQNRCSSSLEKRLRSDVVPFWNDTARAEAIHSINCD